MFYIVKFATHDGAATRIGFGEVDFVFGIEKEPVWVETSETVAV